MAEDPDTEDVAVPVAHEQPDNSADESKTETEVGDIEVGDIVRETENKELEGIMFSDAVIGEKRKLDMSDEMKSELEVKVNFSKENKPKKLKKMVA